MALVDYEITEDGVEIIGHQVLLHWDAVKDSDAYWTCTCGAVSPILPMSGAFLRAALEHQIEHVQAFARLSEAVEAMVTPTEEDE